MIGEAVENVAVIFFQNQMVFSGPKVRVSEGPNFSRWKGSGVLRFSEVGLWRLLGLSYSGIYLVLLSYCRLVLIFILLLKVRFNRGLYMIGLNAVAPSCISVGKSSSSPKDERNHNVSSWTYWALIREHKSILPSEPLSLCRP